MILKKKLNIWQNLENIFKNMKNHLIVFENYFMEKRLTDDFSKNSSVKIFQILPNPL